MNKLVGKVVTNAEGDKAISFTDEAWAELPVGALIYAGAPEVTEPMVDAACAVVIGVSGEYGEYNDRLGREAAREVLQTAFGVIDEAFN